MLWACVLLPQLALDAVLRRLPDPDAPLVLVGGPAQLRTLHAVNAAAAAAGLRAGMRLTAAHALLPDVALVEHDAEAESRWQRFLAAWAYRHSSLVGAQWPGCIVLEVRGSFPLLGPWPRIEARLREELTALGFSHRIALAPTPRAAHVFAGLRDGLALPHPGAMAETLDRVPVRRAHLPGDCGERLQRMGIGDLRALRALPRDAVRRRFGLPLLEHLDQLYGEADDPLAFYMPPDHFDARVELGYEVESHTALLFPLRRLVGDLCTYLSVRDGGVQRFVLRLEHDEGHADVDVGLLAPEREPGMLFELARTRLERVQLHKPVVGLRLLARELPPFVPASRDLFDSGNQQQLPWPRLRERLRARLGDDAVYRIDIAPDPRPERAWKKVLGDAGSHGANKRNGRLSSPAPWPQASSSPRKRGPTDVAFQQAASMPVPATRMVAGSGASNSPMADAYPARATGLAPTPLDPRLRGDDGSTGNFAGNADSSSARTPAAATPPGSTCPQRPAWLLHRPVPLRDRQLRIVRGPERLESGWWDGEDARRDYYVLETTQGQQAWAFAPPGEQGGWMLQGWFA